ncbi:MAG: single-stranded-DNA-specific exonuclease RecJ, partial [Candidatus Binatia bacterium]|nr:single-stranded-DNA-specific exonuclease RecJ [Candidatus Binatia bacterium]
MEKTALLLLFFQALGTEASFYLPDRAQEGYGLHAEALERLKREGVGLVITVDCGISAMEALTHARSIGLGVIVTDHHEPPDVLPPACAVVNPKRRDCPFPFKKLAGVGVAFYLASAVRARLREEGFFRHRCEPDLKGYLDLVALGTLGDVVPLLEENRILVRYGLAELARSNRAGIIALNEVSGLAESSIDSQHVSFRLVPRLNAAGRMGRAEAGVHLLTTTDPEEARRLAVNLNQENIRRQQLEGEVLAEAEAILAAEPDFKKKKVLILSREGWPVGLLGLIASRLAETYYRPTVVLSFEGEIGRGSARSIPSFNLYHGIKDCAHLLDSFGGHAHAAGLSLKRENLECFKGLFEEMADAVLSDTDLVPRLEIDAPITLEEVTDELLEQLQRLAPFGSCNPEPVFAAFGLKVVHSQVVREKHLKLKLSQNDRIRNAIAFGLGHFPTQKGEEVDLVF